MMKRSKIYLPIAIAAVLIAGHCLSVFVPKMWMPVEQKPIPKLHIAIREGNQEEALRLIESGVDINHVDVRHGSRYTPLCDAVAKGCKDIAQILIARGADVNKCCPLNDAVLADNLDMAILLLNNGADPNTPRQHNLPLTLVNTARYGNLEMLKLLIERGADFTAKPDEQWFSLMNLATGNGHLDVVELLASRGAGIDGPPGTRVRTPLHQAAISGHVSVMEFLIAQGADLDRKDSEGKTALDLAKEFRQTEAFDLLRKHGAKE